MTSLPRHSSRTTSYSCELIGWQAHGEVHKRIRRTLETLCRARERLLSMPTTTSRTMFANGNLYCDADRRGGRGGRVRKGQEPMSVQTLRPEAAVEHFNRRI